MEIKQNKLCRWLAPALSLCLVFAGCGGAKETMQEAPELIEPAGAVQENAYAQYQDVYSLRVMETVVLPRQEELCFERAGILEKVYVYTGKQVEKGEVLAELRDDAGEEWERLNEQLTKMREENEYNNRCMEIDIEIARLSGQDVARQELVLAQKRQLQELEEKHLQEQLDVADGERGHHQLVAPFSGIITAIREYREGMAFSENSPLFVLSSEDGRYLQADYIGKQEINSCHEYYAMVDGKRYGLEYIPYTDEELQQISASNGKKVSKYRMVDAQGAGLGKNAFVCIVGEYKENVLALPKSVLYKERRNYFVYRVEGENLVKTPVEVGVLGNTYAEIISGLEEGACVYVEK